MNEIELQIKIKECCRLRKEIITKGCRLRDKLLAEGKNFWLVSDEEGKFAVDYWKEARIRYEEPIKKFKEQLASIIGKDEADKYVSQYW